MKHRIVSLMTDQVINTEYPPYEGPNLANQNIRKFGVFVRKLEGSHSISSGFFSVDIRNLSITLKLKHFACIEVTSYQDYNL